MSFYKEVPGRKTTLESTLKFDTTPTEGSTNPVTSDGVKGAIDGAVGDASEALQQQIDDIAEKAGSGYTPKGEADVATLNGLSGQENGWLYTMTDAGTLTDGSLAVVAGDTVAWDEANSVWYKAMDYAPSQYGTNEVHNLATTASEADLVSGNYLALDGGAGTKKLPAEIVSSKSSLINPVFSLEEEGKYLNYSGIPTTGTGYNIASFNISGFSKIRISLRLGPNAFGIFYDANDNILDRYNGNSNAGINYNVLWNVPSGAVTLKTSYSVAQPINVYAPASLEHKLDDVRNELGPNYTKQSSTTKAGMYPNSVSGTFQSSGTYDSFVFELAEGVAVDIVVEGGNIVLTAETDTAPVIGDYYSDLGRSTHIDRLCHKYLAVCTQASATSCTIYTSDGKAVKKVRALFIGNSMTQDNVMYVPWVLKSAYGNDIDFEIADFYIGSYTIAKFVEDCVNGTQKAEQYSVAKNNKRWTNYGGNVVALDEAISSNDWDLICVQGYFNNTLYTEDMTQIESLVRYISDNANSPFKLCFLMHQTYRDGVLQNIIAGTKYSISNSEVRLVFPCGLASEFAKFDWAESFLTADGTHNQEGLPCIIGAYVIGDLIGKEAGLSSRIMGNKTRLTSSQMSQLNIAGQHGTYQDGDETAWYQAQCFATKALSAGESVFNSGCDDSLSLITE